MKSIVILISGRGSNMQTIVDAVQNDGLPANVAAVVSNRADAGGLGIAQSRGIPTAVVEHRSYATREAFDDALAGTIDMHQPDAVVLAGFMRVFTAPFVERYGGRLINIHPSLLPAFAGTHTHRRVLEAGVKLHGCTVHFVTPEVDCGPIIAQAAVPVLPDDDENTLAARVLKQEHRIYPLALRWLLEDRLLLENNVVRVAGDAAQYSYAAD